MLLVLFVLTVAFASVGCGEEQTPYETNNAENYTVSVKYDANGGIFTTNTSVIVDSYDINALPKNQNSKAELALLSPDDSRRGKDAFAPINNGYFLAGWYSTRTEASGSGETPTYTYSNMWDFEKSVLELDTNKEYRSEEPVITLYAAWVPLFNIEFYSMDDKTLMETYSFDPTATEEIKVPAWSEESGNIEMYKFPQKLGYTFDSVYYDEEGNSPVDSDTVVHSGKINYENGTAENQTLKLYIKWTEGEWYHIYNAEQFVENFSANGNYVLHSDLDFENETWAAIHGNFGGKIIGNGHTMKNIRFEQTNNSKTNTGMFGHLTETAEISDVTFENVSFTIKAGTRVAGASYGLLAGSISNDAKLTNVNILSSKICIDSSCYFGVDDYSIGLVCGMGNYESVTNAEIECIAVGDDPERVTVTVDGNSVTVEIA